MSVRATQWIRDNTVKYDGAADRVLTALGELANDAGVVKASSTAIAQKANTHKNTVDRNVELWNGGLIVRIRRNRKPSTYVICPRFPDKRYPMYDLPPDIQAETDAALFDFDRAEAKLVAEELAAERYRNV